MKLTLILSLILLSLPVYLQGQMPLPELPEDGIARDSDDGIEITEFIFNETITRLGADFYYHFFHNWKNPSDIIGLSIYIKEKPIPGMGGIVTIEIEDQSVYQGFLRPGPQRIIDAAMQAVEQTQSYLINYEMIRKQLESEDQSGGGIF
jgi:hypothetical protein